MQQKKKKILIVVGTRPNFIKVTQFKKVAAEYPHLEVLIAHTGQHYDKNMSDVFFQQFNLTPDYFLHVKGSSTVAIMSNTMLKLDHLLDQVSPSIILAVGDVNSTLCAAIVANKRSILLAHIESGLRSNDREMPEEINRILTDQISDHFFVTEKSGFENLIAEGKNKSNIHFVGNTMIDTLISFQSKIEDSQLLKEKNLESQKYFLVTMHRPSNVDKKESLEKVIDLVERLCKIQKVVFTVHPRTYKMIESFGFKERLNQLDQLCLLPPLDYFSFQKLIANAKLVITDSGGIQEETTFKNVTCFTLRANTERPSTIEEGTNELVPFNVDYIIDKIKQEKLKEGKIPELWDGKSTNRILKVINELLKLT